MDINKIKTINLKTSKKSGPKASKFHKCYGAKCPVCSEPLTPVKEYPVQLELMDGQKIDGGKIVRYRHPVRKHDDSGEMALSA